MDIDTNKLEVINNTVEQRFEVRVGDSLAVIDYRRNGNQLVFLHTGVPRALENRGIGSVMAHAALEYAKAENLEVVPECPFVRGYIRKHPEYQPLVSKNYRPGGV